MVPGEYHTETSPGPVFQRPCQCQQFRRGPGKMEMQQVRVSTKFENRPAKAADTGLDKMPRFFMEPGRDPVRKDNGFIDRPHAGHRYIKSPGCRIGAALTNRFLHTAAGMGKIGLEKMGDPGHSKSFPHRGIDVLQQRSQQIGNHGPFIGGDIAGHRHSRRQIGAFGFQVIDIHLHMRLIIRGLALIFLFHQIRRHITTRPSPAGWIALKCGQLHLGVLTLFHMGNVLGADPGFHNQLGIFRHDLQQIHPGINHATVLGMDFHIDDNAADGGPDLEALTGIYLGV